MGQNSSVPSASAKRHQQMGKHETDNRHTKFNSCLHKIFANQECSLIELKFFIPIWEDVQISFNFFLNYSLLESGKLLLVYLLFDSVGELASFPLGKCL